MVNMGFLDWLSESDVPSIATTPWITIYFRIGLTIPKEWTQKQINKEINDNKEHYLPDAISKYGALKFKKVWTTKILKLAKQVMFTP